MYTDPTMMFELARAKQHDLLVQAEKHNRARRAPKPTRASQTSPGRQSRRIWQLIRPLRPAAQS
jgi:hypothetical protein